MYIQVKTRVHIYIYKLHNHAYMINKDQTTAAKPKIFGVPQAAPGGHCTLSDL